jgi:hypothetical protein
LTTTQEAKQPEASPLPLYQGPGVLSVLTPFDVSALELGMQKFLEHMNQMSRDLVKDQEGSGLWPWVAAVGAAALACEIARRQVKRHAAMSALEESRMGAGFPDPFEARCDHD